MKKIVIASSNNHKVSEISVKIQPFFDKILSLSDFPEIGEIIEDGNTIEENSFKKSRASFEHTNIASIADDTTLEVDALNGDPGLFTARYAGEKATYEENMTKLLDNLDGIEDSLRTARFRTIISFVDGKNDFHVEGRLEGRILNKKIGNNGFGYDPIFQSTEFKMSLAEMDSKLKNEVSHRGLAIKNFISKIREIK
ncbi:MAG: non-canonical purine NTP pyrophosphatase, RdgB/HAM1 family [Candidatus Marinimicrobia bacterium]|jgi:XTP/dITP diphosphohydrolase|nr:MAG: RdgB/HAM1 family non-canonical purine NTP pyrophosphatase [SAR202 cluster bacterium]MAX94022.1 non-canonical purine NTP pyrophosphatase, RdgB/HAM1 family [Candidatus Neomarinimicrobiota bacterium]|tara:strand:+ start:1510 stop:2100 length:591 start_codon:yes stop_codon:yes gene_type:complete